MKVGVLVGSLRQASSSRKIANALPALAPASFSFQEIGFGDLPLYNDDLEPQAPAAWTDLRAAVRACDALLFITPEYNRSIPGGLKNAVDVGSKPTGQNVWGGKPAGIMSQSSGPLGGMAAAHHLRQSLVTVNVPVMPHPEVFLSRVATLFDEQGVIVPATQEFLRGYLQAFETWVRRFAPADSQGDRRQP
jgi:chromate reductase